MIHTIFIRRTIFILIFSVCTTAYIQSSDTSFYEIDNLMSALQTKSGIIKKIDVTPLVTEKKKNEFIQRWKWVDSLTNTILSTSKLYSITTPRQRHIVWESFYYTKGELSYATVLDELKYKNGESVRKWGKYRFRSEKLIAKEEENNPEVNVENLLKTSKSFTF